MSRSSVSRGPQLRRAALVAVVGAALLHPAGAGAGVPKRCDRAHGRELAHSAVVKVFKVKTGDSYRFYGCAAPRGPVIALTQPFRGNRVKLVDSSGAYVAFTRTISGLGTIDAVDARTGKKRRGLYPPDEIEFDIDPNTPQIAAARVNAKGELVVAYAALGDGSSTDSKILIYAFDDRYAARQLDHGPSSRLLATSIRLVGENISWRNNGVTRTAMMGKK